MFKHFITVSNDFINVLGVKTREFANYGTTEQFTLLLLLLTSLVGQFRFVTLLIGNHFQLKQTSEEREIWNQANQFIQFLF